MALHLGDQLIMNLNYSPLLNFIFIFLKVCNNYHPWRINSHAENLKGAMSLGYCCLRPILCWSHYLNPLPLLISLRFVKKNLIKIPQGTITIIFLVFFFSGIAIETWNKWPNSLKFQCTAIIAIILSYMSLYIDWDA